MTYFSRIMLAVFAGTLLLGIGCAVANAEDKCLAPIATVQETAKSLEKVSVIKMSEADKAKINENLNPPPVEEPYDMFVVFAPDFSRILIVKEECVIGFSGELPARAIRNITGLEEAGL